MPPRYITRQGGFFSPTRVDRTEVTCQKQKSDASRKNASGSEPVCSKIRLTSLLRVRQTTCPCTSSCIIGASTHLYTSDVSRFNNMPKLAAVAGAGEENQARYPVQLPPTPPPTNSDDNNDVEDDEVSVSIESIAVALESGQRQSVRLPSTPQQQRQQNTQRFSPRSTRYHAAQSRLQDRPDGENGREHGAGRSNGQKKGANGKQSGPPNR